MCMLKHYSKGFLITLLLLLLLQPYHTYSKDICRIIGGKDDRIKSVPSLVQLYKNGFLVSKQFVITAAHCVSKNKPPELVVKAGAATLLENGVLANVSKIFIPKAFSSSTFNMDIAVLKLETPLEGPLIQPADLCEERAEQGEVVEAYGWGIMEADYNLNPNQLQTAKLFLMNKNECKDVYRNYSVVTDTMICASAPGIATCQGDSGSPIFIKNKFWGKGCALAGFPDVYTDLMNPSVQKFIKRVIES